MKNLDLITKENFKESFDLLDLLSNSVFYPAAGLDATDVECLSHLSNSFVHVDYSHSKKDVEIGMLNHFEDVGYELIGLKDVTKSELLGNNFRTQNIDLNSHERKRLEKRLVSDRLHSVDFDTFAIWAVYELNVNKTKTTEGKSKRFSLLHIGGEACATLEAIYVSNKINPLAVSIILPGEGFGDNWTIFRDPKFRLYQSLLFNNKMNHAAMPRYVLAGNIKPDSIMCFWPDYILDNSVHCKCSNLFSRKE